MHAALIIYIIFLAIEGGLAWVVSGNPFLLAAVTCGLLCYAAVWKIKGPWGELARALAAGLIAVAGPLYYQASLVPTLLCFLSLPHLLAATQCFWEIALGKDPTPHNMRMRMVVFTVAFYAAMGLVFVLLRGTEAVSAWITAPLAVLVLVLAVPAWDLARVTRLKNAHSAQRVPLGLKLRRLALLAALLGAMAAVFSGVLPAAAEKLCEVSPRWRIKDELPDQAPPHGDKPSPGDQNSRQPSGSSRPGVDSSAVEGRHTLPQQADIQATGAPVLYVKIKDPAVSRKLEAGVIYVRSHTLDEWKDGSWSPAVQGGGWVNDAADGASDGLVTLSKPGPEAIAHTVYLQSADGYALPALQNVNALQFPKVWSVPGDVQQAQVTGSIRYDAVSSPLNWESLPDTDRAAAGKTQVTAQTRKPESQALMNLIYSDRVFDSSRTRTLAEQVAAVRRWMQQSVRYSTKVSGDPNLTPLDNFLVGERRGYCDFFATAGALMLRYFDVPTRVAYGYATKKFDAEAGVFVFADTSAHAWTEIFVQGRGWVICDFTPEEGRDGAGEDNSAAADRSGFDEKQFASQKDTEKEKPEENQAAQEKSLSEWWKETLTHLSQMDAMERAKKTLTWLAAALALFLIVRSLRRKKKSEEKTEGAGFAKDEKQPPYFAEFVRVFQEAGCPRRQGSTPREYLAMIRARGFGGEEFIPMIEYHYERRYAGADRDRKLEEEWVALARAVENRLRQRPAQN